MFGQVVIGPPGSGKSTYCKAMQQFLSGLGRKVLVVNLDPANSCVSSDGLISITDLITVQDVMEQLSLGPNGALIYCMEYLEKNLSWLQEHLDLLTEHYLLFDCPGQVELYTHNNCMRNVFAKLSKWDFRLVATHLVDAHYCTEPAKFISAVFVSLSTMLQIGLPHINILSKIDLIEKFGRLAFNLEVYTEVLDMNFLLSHMLKDDFKKYRKLNEQLVEVIHDYSLVSFTPLNIQDKGSMQIVLKQLDTANGFSLSTPPEKCVKSLLSETVTVGE